MAEKVAYTVWHAFYDILRGYGIKTIFGNPGSTELPMLMNFPDDFDYVFGLQEASVVGMADGYSQATRKPAIVSLHTSAGTGNGMGNIITAFLGKTPLVIIAGQQTRQMLIGDPLLANRDATDLPKPWVKLSYQPSRAEDVPAAVVRAIVTAMMPPAGPVYLSIPMDDWSVEVTKPILRSVTPLYAPHPPAIQQLADSLRKADHPVLVLGPEVDRSLAWESAISLAEHLNIPVYQSPISDRAVFPELHPLYKGPLFPGKGLLSRQLSAHDFILVVGAEIWRYYPWIPGSLAPEGTQIVQITNDNHDASAALIGNSILSDVKLALDSLNSILGAAPVTLAQYEFPKPNLESHRVFPSNTNSSKSATSLTAAQAFSVIASLRPNNAILLQESPSNITTLLKVWPALKPESYFTMASGGLGWNGPAAVGVAMAQQGQAEVKPVILVIGDGSVQYSVQSLWTAAQRQLHLICVVPRNEEYGILKQFAISEKTPGAPGLELPGLDICSIARGYGVPSVRVKSAEDLGQEFAAALERKGPSLIEVEIAKETRSLIEN